MFDDDYDALDLIEDVIDVIEIADDFLDLF